MLGDVPYELSYGFFRTWLRREFSSKQGAEFFLVRERIFDGRRKKAVFAGRRYGTWWKI